MHLASILNHHARTHPGPRHQASETRSLTQGTGGWSALPGIDGHRPLGSGGHVDLTVAADVVAGEVAR